MCTRTFATSSASVVARKRLVEISPTAWRSGGVSLLPLAVQASLSQGVAEVAGGVPHAPAGCLAAWGTRAARGQSCRGSPLTAWDGAHSLAGRNDGISCSDPRNLRERTGYGHKMGRKS